MPGNNGLKTYTKELRIKAVSGAECTPEMLAKINSFALNPLKAEDVYVRKFLMAHNCIDRDNERFPEPMLDQFAATMPGKACIPSHDRKSLPLATWFDSSTESMTPDQFKALTGETPNLPPDIDQVKVQWAWMYTLVKDWNQQLRDSLDAGIIRFCSIGFAAADLNSVKESPTGPTLYWEYCCPGEAMEGSLVWLGAQQGAGSQKQALQPNHEKRQEEESMKEFLAKLGKALGLSKALEEDGAVDAIKAVIDEKNAKISELEPLAADGKSYRDALVADSVKFATLLGEIGDDEKSKKDEEDFLKTVPIARLKAQRDKYEAKAREKFPTHSIFTGKDATDREERGKEGERHSQETKGKKDYSRPENNELFGLVGGR